MGKPRVNRWAIRRIVDPMSIHSTEDQVRARARECCAPGSSVEFIQRCEDEAVKYFRSVTAEVRHG